MIEEKDLISIIVPVYNAETYLPYCLQSIVNQQYTQLEIILIDDGSIDHSAEVCEQWVNKDNRIVFRKQENAGPAVTRNLGIQISKGTYIAFVDSDDFIADDFILHMYELMQMHKAELVQSAIRNVHSFDIPEWTQKEEITVFEGREFLRAYYNKKYMGFANPVNKLYKRELLTGLEFPAGRIHEDAALTYKLYARAEKTVYTNKELYYYYMSPGSIMRKRFNLQRLDWLLALEEKMDFLKEHEEIALYHRAFQEYQAVLLKSYYNVKRFYPSESEQIDRILYKIKQNYQRLMKVSEISTFSKFVFTVGNVLPYMTGSLMNHMI